MQCIKEKRQFDCKKIVCKLFIYFNTFFQSIYRQLQLHVDIYNNYTRYRINYTKIKKKKAMKRINEDVKEISKRI